jgi:isopropylmalate/homocitrate/citramalate synthase
VVWLRYEVNVSPLNFLPEVRGTMRLPNSIIIHDTTLREGEQTPGVVFKPEDKLAIARMLDAVGIQQIEAGFPAASQGERSALRMLVKEGLKAQIFGFARAVKSDIDEVVKCEAYGLVLSFPPSDMHLKYKLKITREQYLERAVELVEYAKAHGLYVTYSAEDSTRTDLGFLLKVFRSVVEAGCDRARIVDTLGCVHPTSMRYLVKQVRQALPEGTPIEVHCHNDHGLGLANTLAALEEGASVVSSAVNGLGERAGVTATEEVIVALHNLYGVEGFNTERLYELCKLVERVSNVKIQPHKPVAGDNVFIHVSGVHQHAVMVNPVTYEPYPPELVGQRRRLVIGKLSGRHAVKAKLEELGFHVSEEEAARVTEAVKAVSEERKSTLSDEEFLKLAEAVLGRTCR